MKVFALLIAMLTLFSRPASAGGGGEDIYFTMPGWTLHLSSADGSSAYLSHKDGSHELTALLRFEHFWDYWAAFQSLHTVSSKLATGNKRQCYLVESDSTGKEQRRYYDFAAAESLLALLLFQHRGHIYADEPDAFRKVFFETPLLPVVRDWQRRADWSHDFVIHDRTKDPIK